MSVKYLFRNWEEPILTPMLMTPDGAVCEVRPAGKIFTLEELQGLMGGNVQLITLPNGLEMWINEEGKNDNLLLNVTATMLWKTIYYGYKIGSEDYMVGPVLLTPKMYTNE